MTDSTDLTQLTQRVADLESTVAFLDDTVDQLNQVIAKQDAQLQDHHRLIKRLTDLLQQQDSDIAPFDLLMDRPPHH